mmetsp:Transcript_435/g.674  ORF Transcript_435/g.674 Transcript_435/m.674 type:complete len:828 (-) Transcript_435:139-2622(-)|eukprot:CAMPEP_0119011314 /NCGR_PEP_ID=MMETSP1176-20130426/5594_1 /TAXON_ID=265551 /ORGANISM="Synedropsis recta cf, Strain CCMP1620" /LENGTH=827 /DNA_ID=CAMNT_0006964115 /DNA_START=31 /DNA_END=2514 /DNA_ORIENTATION=+
MAPTKNKESNLEVEWKKAFRKIFFLGLDEDDDDKEPPTPPNVLMEVVSARGLTSIPGVDPSCLIRVGNKEVHRTNTIWNDPDPIWTVKTKSLCLLWVPKDDNDDEEQCSVVVEVNHGNQCIGIVTIPFKEVLSKTGDREEFPIRFKPGRKKKKDEEEKDLGTLALRFRKPVSDDYQFFQHDHKHGEPHQSKKKAGAADIDFKRVRGPSASLFTSKRGKDGKLQYKTQPEADPRRVEETTWLTEDQLKEEALKPSTKWTEAGYGEMGIVYVEIIGCDNLVNMDVGLNNFTDSFAAIICEDNMVRTTVNYDCLNPRWMPWSDRAFSFKIGHPSSLIFLGVFDYDALGNHDPIGRVVINTSNFQSNTSYLLQYRLHNDIYNADDRGTIAVRLRVEWKSESDAVNKTLTLPPRYLINVETEKTLDVIRYLCRGPVNVSVASLDSVKLYAKELMEYGSVICYVIDVMIGVWLWRGRTNVPILGNIWCPMHSVFVFTAAVLAIEFPLMIPTIVFYSVAWILLAIGYNSSIHPDPWQRCKSVGELNMVRLTGRSIHGPIHIEPNVGVEEAVALKKLDKVKAARVKSFLLDLMKVGLKVRKIYKKADVANIAITTEESTSWSILGNSLYYVHLMLYSMVTILNTFRNFANWKGYGAYSLSMQFVFMGTIFLVFPMQYVLLWTARVVVWVLLGPWMKVIDIMYIHPIYRTRDELKVDPEFHGTNLESILASDSIQKMVRNDRLAGEDAIKLKDMREHQFGKLSFRVPAVDTQSKPNIPLPSSTAQPYLGTKGDTTKGFVDVDNATWCCISGQNLTGTMVMHHLAATHTTESTDVSQ